MSAPLVRRPTENVAIRRAARSVRPLPPLPELFAGLCVARRMRDRHGECLLAHAIARRGLR